MANTQPQQESEGRRASTADACRWCGSRLQQRRVDAVYCSRRCRQTAWRLSRRRGGPVAGPSSGPGLFIYADPPYPGTAARYYRHEPTFAGEVDHAALIASLTTSGALGWALSTSAAALRDVLPMCPPGARVCSWVKPIGVSRQSHGLHNTWEPLIVVGGRALRPGIRDWLRAMPARGGGELPGRKPIAFCGFLFDALGMLPGDELRDIYPGTGVVGRAWHELSARSSATGVARRRQSATRLGSAVIKFRKAERKAARG